MDLELQLERKKMIYDFICDELYVPMKAKEMAVVLGVPKGKLKSRQKENIRRRKANF